MQVRTKAAGSLLIAASVALAACGTTRSLPVAVDAAPTSASGGAGGSAAGTGATASGSGGMGITAGAGGTSIGTGSGGSGAQCQFQREQAATCMSQMPFIDVTIDGEHVRYADACG